MLRLPCFAALLLAISASAAPIRVLIVDGHNNHDWRSTTDCLQATLEATGRFSVAVSTAPSQAFPRVPHRSQPADKEALAAARAEFAKVSAAAKTELEPRWQAWSPDFKNADVVVLNYNGLGWRPEVGEAYLDFVRDGGGTVLVHAANNGFRNWESFNELIGLGWRPSEFGTAIKVDPDTGKAFAAADAELAKGGASGHGSKHAFQVTVRASDHPIMRGLPPVWMHARDELYHHMRGPAEKLTVLSSAWSEPKQRGSGYHEPITWETAYGKGRAIVTSMGHLWLGDLSRGEPESLYCVGFQTVFARACEYAATGEVTQPVPEGFPGADEPHFLAPHAVNWPKPEPGPNAAAISMQKKKEADPYSMLSPEEELATFEIAPGYVAELFAAEPDVQEPVLTVWDSDGAMYVAEMRSYMQDADGTGTKTLRNGRVKRLVDSDGDGRADQVTVFIDKLNLPRCILPLGDGWIAVRETDTMTVVGYRDSDGDGVADETKMLYERGPYSRNSPGKSVEHQDSGLMWNLDNHIYITYNMERYRFTRGSWEAEKQPGHWTQWGLAHDDVGELYWSTNSDPVVAADIHPRYWDIPRRIAKNVPNPPVVMPKAYSPGFMTAYSSCTLNDRGGSASADRAFTSACGQSIYRGDKFPVDARGNYFICDPTIHVVRRASISKPGELIRIDKPEPDGQEFLRSSDINSRFVNSAEGPDGCLYITDMYRGIIQDAPWLNPGSRENIRKNGLDDNNQHGRIWRIRHRDFSPRSKAPAMSKEPAVALIRHLESPSGWWRDTAQREIILREDRDSIAPHLAATLRFAENPLGRLHALWTLEGMDKIDLDLLSRVTTDRDPRLRRAAIQIAEATLAEPATFDAVARPLAGDRDASVAKQLILSLGLQRAHPDTLELIQKACRKHPNAAGVQLAGTLALWGERELPLTRAIAEGKAFPPATNAMWQNILGNWNRGLKFPDDMPDAERRRITGGETQYFAACVACHGADGKGMGVPGTELRLAPSLADSARVAGDPKQLLPVFLHGLMGPIAGKTYQAGFMAPAAALGITREDRLAELITYLRFVYGKGASSVSADDIKRAKHQHKDRSQPWTDEQLLKLLP
jgi:putative membrane-bound dehydrogenase-like protein